MRLVFPLHGESVFEFKRRRIVVGYLGWGCGLLRRGFVISHASRSSLFRKEASSLSGMILVLEAVCDNLQELLGVLLLAADALLEGRFEDTDKGERRDGLFRDGPFIEGVKHIFEALRDKAVLHTLNLPGRQLLTVGLDNGSIDGGILYAAAVSLADEIYSQVAKPRKGLEDRVYEAVICLVSEADNGLLLGRGAVGIEGKGWAEDVDEGDGSEGRAGRVRDDRPGSFGHVLGASCVIGACR